MSFRAGIVVCALLSAVPALASDSGLEEAAAAWKKHEVDLPYMGFTTRYTCSGLKSKSPVRPRPRRRRTRRW